MSNQIFSNGTERYPYARFHKNEYNVFSLTLTIANETVTAIHYDTVVTEEIHGLTYNPATGIFSVAEDMRIRIEYMTSLSSNVGFRKGLIIPNTGLEADGVGVDCNPGFPNPNTNTNSGVATIDFTAGEIWGVYGYQATGGNIAVFGTQSIAPHTQVRIYRMN